MTKTYTVSKLETLYVYIYIYKYSKIHRLPLISMKLQTLSLMESNASLLRVIWTRDSCDTDAFISSFPLLYYLTDLGISLYLRFSSHLPSHLFQATCESHGFAGKQSKHSINKQQRAGNCKQPWTWFTTLQNYMVFGQRKCTRVCSLAAFFGIVWFLRISNIQPATFQVQV